MLEGTKLNHPLKRRGRRCPPPPLGSALGKKWMKTICGTSCDRGKGALKQSTHIRLVIPTFPQVKMLAFLPFLPLIFCKLKFNCYAYFNCTLLFSFLLQFVYFGIILIFSSTSTTTMICRRTVMRTGCTR